ncbi:L-aspartate oxidase [Arthrobacter sp. A5]|uniref:L-aspartate oxidase n=1 Tax=Arthrobacter sp. A5 TaxID=576926 RepID=UPI003DA84966
MTTSGAGNAGGAGSAAARRIVVVGSGIAGLYGALLAAEAGDMVTLLTKGALEQSNTRFAQGGICAVLGSNDAAPGDSVEAHIADTLKAGAGHCDPEAVRILCTEAKDDIARLENFGVNFDIDASSGGRALGLEAAHSAARILHAGGDATGAAIAQALIGAVLARSADDGELPRHGLAGGRLSDCAEERGTWPGAGRIAVLEHAFMTELTSTGGRVDGVSYLHDGAAHQVQAGAVLLATGGAGRMFEYTTNPSVATGDGLAAAWRAGAVVTDTEFFQFHPTALAVPGNFMISEAVRGAGAVLRDSAGHRFMPDYHPDAELAPRDVVSRSIALHLAAIGADPDATVFLDATVVETTRGAGYLASRFPTIDAAVRRLGFDWTRELLPVIPAAHYWMGGVATDLLGRTSLPGLYAAGEVACTGVHGANRLASNSLLEGLVFARRAVADFTASDFTGAGSKDDFVASGLAGADLAGGRIAARAIDCSYDGATRSETVIAVHALQSLHALHAGSETGYDFEVAELGRLMARSASVIRDGAGLDIAAKQLDGWAATAPLAAWAAVPVGSQTAKFETAEPGRAGRKAVHMDPAKLPDQQEFERWNLLTASRLLVHAAGHRTESIGAHFRSDHSGADAAARPEKPSRAFWVRRNDWDVSGTGGSQAPDPGAGHDVRIKESEQL